MNLIIFDMDGTLVNSGNAISKTINHVRYTLGLPSLANKEILTNLNNPDINASKYFYDADSFTKMHKKLFEKYYYNCCIEDLKPYPGIKELLDFLSNTFLLSVATNANSSYASRMLKHVELDTYFSSIVGYEKVENPKPHPDMVNYILNKHNIKKNKAQLIGDSRKDLLAAKNAGINSILVNWGFSDHDSGISDINILKENILDNIIK